MTSFFRDALRALPHPASQLLLFSLFIILSVPVFAQRADHLTKKEVELIQEYQEVDRRMEIYTRAIERRLLAIEGTGRLNNDEMKQLEKEEETWGPLPEGNFSQIIADVPRILDEAVNKIEDVAERNSESDLFPFAVYILSDYSASLAPRLEALKARATTAHDIGLLNLSISQCADIVEASEKVPRPDPKDRKKKKKTD